MELNPAILLIGGLTLLLWGITRLKDALQRMAGQRLKSFMATLSTNRFSAVGVGTGVTFVFQSSGATTSILVGFAAAGLVTLERAMAVLLGANIGTTFTVQIIAFQISDLALLVVAAGFLIERLSQRSRIRAFGSMLFGFGFIFFGIFLMSAATKGLQNNPTFIKTLTHFSESPLLAIAVGAVATAISQSSAATIAVVISFASTGDLSIGASIALVLGANIGTCSMAFLAAVGEGPEAKRVAWAHILMKIISVLLVIPFLAQFEGAVLWLGGDEGRQIANAHTILNVVTAFAFLPLLPLGEKLLLRLIQPKDDPKKFGARYLDSRALETPVLAFGQVTLELHRMAGIVDSMIKDCIRPFESDSPDLVDELEERDQRIDVLERDIKLYLARIHQNEMSPEDARQSLDLFATAIDLETVGDIITKNICHLARKRISMGEQFTSEGLEELKQLHQAVYDNFKLSLSAFTLKDPMLAGKVIREKRRLRLWEEKLRASHFERLHTGRPSSIATTSIHADLVANLLHANSAISRLAYRIVRTSDVTDEE